MSTVGVLLLTLGMMGPAADPSAPPDLARLREMLLDRQSGLQQAQAALLLVSSPDPDAAEVVRQGLRQTDSPEVFLALASALRITQDRRFLDELLTALTGGRANVRQVAAETLAVLATNEVILRLQALIEDPRADIGVRQAAVAALGGSGRKQAAVVLLDQLSADQDAIRKAAADALAELTGLAYGFDLARWRAWWEKHKDLSNEAWLERRLAYQTGRARRLEGDLERSRGQLLRLHQHLYSRLPAADRLGHVQSLLEQEDPAVRALAVQWSVEMLSSADALGQRTLADVLLRLSQDGSPEIQRSAVLALGRVADPRAFERLRLMIRQGPAPVRAAAARALTQQARGKDPEAPARQRQVVPVLQKALEDPAIEVVIEAAEDLGGLGVPEAAPVLAGLLQHSSEAVRQAAAQALERVADASVLESLLEALNDPAVSVRFSVLGALARAASESRALTDSQRNRLFSRVETALTRDVDPGVRSRAATVLGDCGGAAALPALWKRVLAGEDGRVQEKAWAAMVEVIARSNSGELLQQWDRALTQAKQPVRRLQLLSEVHLRWQKKEETRALADLAVEALVQAHLEQGKWAAAFPHVRELLARTSGDADLDRRLRWLLTVGELALAEGNKAEALRVVQEAQGPLGRRKQLAAEFEKLEKQAKQE